MAISVLQRALSATATHPNTAAFPSDVAVGTLLYVAIRVSAGVTSATVVDTLLNSYSLIDFEQFNGGGATLLVYAAISGSAGANTVTVSNGSAGAERLAILEISGLVTSSVAAAQDQLGTNSAASGTNLDLATALTTTQADEILIVAGASTGDTTFTVGTDYSNLQTAQSRLATQERIVSATGDYNTGGLAIGASQAWASLMVTFKAAAAAGNTGSDLPLIGPGGLIGPGRLAGTGKYLVG